MSVKKIKIIWVVLLVLFFAYFLIAWKEAGVGRAPAEDWREYQRLFFKIGVVVWILAWFVLPKLMIAGIRKKLGSPARGFSVEKYHGLGAAFRISVVQWALFQAVAQLGWILALKASNQQQMVPFLVAALLGHLFSFPSQSRLETLQKRVSPHSRDIPGND